MANTFTDMSKVTNMDFPLAINRQSAFPLDLRGYHLTLESAKTYAKTHATAYVGQIITVAEGGKADIYKIANTAGDLELVGSSSVLVGASAPDAGANKYEQGALYLNTTDGHLHVNKAVKTAAAEWVQLVNAEDISALGGGDMLKSVYAATAKDMEGKTGYVDKALLADTATTATTATKLGTKQNISITGDVTAAAVAFDGSAAVVLNATLPGVGTAGDYVGVTTDAKGRVTAGTATIAQDKVDGLADKLGALEAKDTELAEQITELGKTSDGKYVPKADLVATGGTDAQKQKVPQLNNNGKLDISFIPALELSNVYTTAQADKPETCDKAAEAQAGDICLAGSEAVTAWILTKAPGTTHDNWKKLAAFDESAINGLIDAKVNPVSQKVTTVENSVTELTKKVTDLEKAGHITKDDLSNYTYVITAANAAGAFS